MIIIYMNSRGRLQQLFAILFLVGSGCGSPQQQPSGEPGPARVTTPAIVSWHGVKQIGVANQSVYSDYGENGLSIDTSGNVYITGYTNTNLITESGSSVSGVEDGFVRKYNSSGTLVWTTQFGVPGNFYIDGAALAIDTLGNVFVSGTTQGNLITGVGASTGTQDAFLIKFNSSGVKQWTRQIGVATYDTFSSEICLDQAENIFITGTTKANLMTGAGAATGAQDAFLIKFDSSGVKQWTRQVGLATYDTYTNGIRTDNVSNVYIAGGTSANLMTRAGGASGTQDAFLIKFDSAGVRQWTQQVGVPSFYTVATGVSVDYSGTAFIIGSTEANLMSGVGSSTGSSDAYLIKFSSSGVKQWTEQVGIASFGSYAFGVALDHSGNVYTTGFTYGNLVSGAGAAKGGNDAFLIKVDASGAKQWTRQLGVASFSTSAFGIAVDALGNVLIAGNASGNLISGTGVCKGGLGNTDAFIAEFNSSGALQ